MASPNVPVCEAVAADPGVRPRMTEEEFVGWCKSDVWAEWVDGEVTVMPAIRPDHGKLIVFVTKLVGGFVEEHDLGDVFPEPVHVRLPQQPSRRSPDLFSSRRQTWAESMTKRFKGRQT